jgi:Uma2 family endonuclease
MQTATIDKVHWTTADLALFPDNGNRYEIIDGELFVTKAPHWNHQEICVKIAAALNTWCQSTGLGQVAIAPGIIFSDADNVIPDVVWISNQKLSLLLDESGHLTAAPELIIEVLSQGKENERRDRELKLKLYSTRGVQEYWLVDWRLEKIEIYHRQNASLRLIKTLNIDDIITSELLPDFTLEVKRIFA